MDETEIPSIRELAAPGQAVSSAALAHPALLEARERLPIRSSLPLPLFSCKMGTGLDWCIVLNLNLGGKIAEMLFSGLKV